jgi:hypothetical protein
MTQILRTAVLLLTLAALHSEALGQRSSWDRYRIRSVQSVIDQHAENITLLDKNAPPPKDAFLVTGDNFPTRTSLKYLGKVRAISGKRKELLVNVGKSFPTVFFPSILVAFDTEALFEEKGAKRWIAVQTRILQGLKDDVKRGEEIRAYVIWLGAVRDGKKWEWLFAMNKFETAEDMTQQDTVR